jgi:hypothetical protein
VNALERSVEALLLRRVAALGGVALKLNSQRGLPDRLVVLPGARVIAIELKRPRGGRLSVHQKIWLAKLRGLGIEVAVVRNASDIDARLGLAEQEPLKRK